MATALPLPVTGSTYPNGIQDSAAKFLRTAVLAALALGLAGQARLSRVMGANQGWNRAGNIAAALLAMAMVSAHGSSGDGSGCAASRPLLRFLGTKARDSIAFWVLPVRILTYSLATAPSAVVWLQRLDGIGAGIYGVAVAAFSADLTKGKGGQNPDGSVRHRPCGGRGDRPVLSGVLVQHFGFHKTFCAFAALAGLGAAVFTLLVPETSRFETAINVSSKSSSCTSGSPSTAPPLRIDP
jgi:hypothetical protein